VIIKRLIHFPEGNFEESPESKFDLDKIKIVRKPYTKEKVFDEMNLDNKDESGLDKNSKREFISRHNCSCIHDIDELIEKSNYKKMNKNKLTRYNRAHYSYNKDYYKMRAQNEPIYALQYLTKYQKGPTPKIKEITLGSSYSKNE